MNEKYIPLYRKYRPQRLEEIVGQEHIKNALTNAIKINKISHAYLFTGPRGTGKTSTARIFAKSLNCENGPTITPCNKCSNCTNITNSIPIDVIEIDAASNRSVNDADEIIKKVVLAPVQSRYKIYIIDEVHMLTPQAFNALLKTLEEPPENVIFILATTEVHKVLDTIKSRCQRFDFRRITTDDIVKHLRYISDNEKINITDDALATIAKNSAGGMRDSIALLDQLSILGGEKAISTEDIYSLLGRISFVTLKELSDAIINSNAEQAIEILEKIYNSGNEPSLILSNLLDYFKNLLIVKNCNINIVQELTQLNEEQINIMTNQAKELETHQITSLIDKTSSYIREIKITNNPKLWLEVGIIDLANLTENTKLADLQERITKLESGQVQAGTPAVKSIQKPQPEVISEVHKIKEQFIAKKEAEEAKNLPNSQDVKSELTNTTISPKESPVTNTVNATDNKASETKPEEIYQKAETGISSEFSPMPKAKPLDKNDISVLWGELLSAVSSTPTRVLMKQWVNPIKITPGETILSIKNEMLLNQFTSGNKKLAVINAVDTLFSQTESNVIVRLPLPSDVQIKAENSQPKTPVKISAPTQKPPVEKATEKDTLDVDDIQNENEDSIQNEDGKQIIKTKSHAVNHSDQVNMVMDLFDGKIIE